MRPSPGRDRRTWVRLLKVAVAVAIVVSGLIAAQSSVEATMAAVGGMFVAGAVLWWRHQREVATSVVALVVTCVLTGYITTWSIEDEQLAARTGIAFWIFAAVLTIAAWTPRRHLGNRGLTVVLAHTVLVVASPLTEFSPGSGTSLGLLAGMSVVAGRGGGWLALRRWWWRRRPSPTDQPQPPPEQAAGSGLASPLALPGPPWWDLGPRRITKQGPRIDHVLVGPRHIMLVQNQAWVGRVSLVRADHETDHTLARMARSPVYALDGDPVQLAERLRPIVAVNLLAQHRLNETSETLWSVLVFADSTSLPDRVTELDIWPERGDDLARVVLLRREHLTRWLADLTDGIKAGPDQELRGRVAAYLPAAVAG